MKTFSEYINEVKVDSSKTVEDMQGTDDWLFALTPAMEKIFGKGKVSHHWKLDFPSVEGKTVGGAKFVFGVGIGDDFETIDFIVHTESDPIFYKEVLKIKETNTVAEINKKAESIKKDVIKMFNDIKTIEGSTKGLIKALQDDGFNEIG